MKMKATYTVNSHDVDYNGIVNAAAIVKYMQETANLQHAAYGPTIDELRAGGHAFVLSRASLDLYAPVRALETITVETWFTEAKGFGYHRNTVMTRGTERVAAMVSFWGMIDIATRRPIRVEEIALGFGPDDEALTIGAPPRARAPRELTLMPLGKRTVVYSDCDENGHMNNTRYPGMFCDFLPTMAGRRVTGVSINYASEARLGSSFTVFGGEEDGGAVWWFRTELENGQTGTEARIALAPIEAKA